MDNFKAVYKILSSLEASMDLEKPNIDMFSAATLGVSYERWAKYMEMMLDCLNDPPQMVHRSTRRDGKELS